MPEQNIVTRIDQRLEHHAQQMEIRLKIAQMTCLYLQQFARDACGKNWPVAER